MVSEVRVTLLRPSEALLSWRPPSDPEEDVLNYEARYFTKVRVPRAGRGAWGGVTISAYCPSAAPITV